MSQHSARVLHNDVTELSTNRGHILDFPEGLPGYNEKMSLAACLLCPQILLFCLIHQGNLAPAIKQLTSQLDLAACEIFNDSAEPQQIDFIKLESQMKAGLANSKNLQKVQNLLHLPWP